MRLVQYFYSECNIFLYHTQCQSILYNYYTTDVSTLAWTITNEAATEADDYVKIERETLEFPVGISSASFEVTVVNDKLVEPEGGAMTEEIFQLALVKSDANTECVLGTIQTAMQTAVVKIEDDDCE